MAIAASQFVLIANSEAKKLKAGELRRELKNRGLGTRGLKKELQVRLLKAIEDRVPTAPAVTEEVAPAIVLGEGARWKVLAPNQEPASEPPEGIGFHAPTVGTEEVPIVKNHDFSITFDRQPLIAHRNVGIVDRLKRRKTDPRSKKLCRRKKLL